MEIMIPVIFLTFIPITIVYALYTANKQNKIYTQTAEQFGLKTHSKSFFSNVLINGHFNKYFIKTEYIKRKRKIYLKLSIDYISSFQNDFSIKKENFLSFLRFTEDKDIGVAEFDSKYLLSSSSDLAITAISSFDFRRYINDLNEKSKYFNISNNKIEVEVEKSKIKSSEDLDVIIEHCLKIINEINRPSDIKKRLIENSKFDPNRKVQAINLKILSENYNNDVEFENVINDIKHYESAKDRILAVPYLGEEGMIMLLNILKEKNSDNETICDALKLLEIQKTDDDYKILTKILERNTDENVIAAVIHAIGRLGLSKYEEYVLNNISHNSRSIRELSIESIAKCGTAGSIEKLHKIMDDTVNPFLRKKYSQSIAKIQSRLGDVEKGWVSIENTDNLDGALSKDKISEKGKLSIQKGQK